MEKKTRNQKIYEYREFGKTFKETGQHFGISSTRAGQIYKVMKKRQNWQKFRKAFPVRVQSAILSIFERDEDIFNHPEKIAQISFKDLIKYKNMGIVAAENVKKTCKEFGYPMAD